MDIDKIVLEGKVQNIYMCKMMNINILIMKLTNYYNLLNILLRTLTNFQRHTKKIWSDS
jgi:hypothetical protein